MSIFLGLNGFSKENTKVGVVFSPANYPNHSRKDTIQFFEDAKKIASHIVVNVHWKKPLRIAKLYILRKLIRAHGMKFHLYFNPIEFYGMNKKPTLPKNIGNTFRSKKVRWAYKKMVKKLINLKPDVFGLANEANLLALNSREFFPFITLSQETYRMIKAIRSNQKVTMSFQWDYAQRKKQFRAITSFHRSLDIYSFTTYPHRFRNYRKIPENYYSYIKKIIPYEKPIAFAGVGWSAKKENQQVVQAKFYYQLVQKAKKLKVEFMSLALLNDIILFKGKLKKLNTVGLKTKAGKIKESYKVFLDLKDF